MRRLVEQHQVQGEVVQVLSAAVQVSRASLDRLVGDRLFALGRDERPNGPLQQVLVDATVFVQEPERRLEAMRERLPLGVRETLIIHAPKPIGDAHVAGLREKRRVVHEAPERQQAVHATGVAIVAKDSADAHHRATSTSTRSCFPGSYRRRAFDEASRIRSISGSRAVAHRANP